MPGTPRTCLLREHVPCAHTAAQPRAPVPPVVVHQKAVTTLSCGLTREALQVSKAALRDVKNGHSPCDSMQTAAGDAAHHALTLHQSYGRIRALGTSVGWCRARIPGVHVLSDT